MRKIKNTYLGIPKYLTNQINWVEREYKKYSRSNQSGTSCDIVIVYDNGIVKGYSGIDSPSKYINKIEINQYLIEIYARNSYKFKKINKFSLVWERKDGIENIINSLKKFDNGYYEKLEWDESEIISLPHFQAQKKYFLLGFSGESLKFALFIKISDFIGYFFERHKLLDSIAFLTTLADIKESKRQLFNIENYCESSKYTSSTLIVDQLVSIFNNDTNKFIENVKYESSGCVNWEFINGIESVFADNDRTWIGTSEKETIYSSHTNDGHVYHNYNKNKRTSKFTSDFLISFEKKIVKYKK